MGVGMEGRENQRLPASYPISLLSGTRIFLLTMVGCSKSGPYQSGENQTKRARSQELEIRHSFVPQLLSPAVCQAPRHVAEKGRLDLHLLELTVSWGSRQLPASDLGTVVAGVF